MSTKGTFAISLALAVLTVVLLLVFEPGITPLYQAIIILLSFALTLTFFVIGIVRLLRKG